MCSLHSGKGQGTLKKGGTRFAGGKTADRRDDFLNFWFESGGDPYVPSPQWEILFVFIEN